MYDGRRFDQRPQYSQPQYPRQVNQSTSPAKPQSPDSRPPVRPLMQDYDRRPYQAPNNNFQSQNRTFVRGQPPVRTRSLTWMLDMRKDRMPFRVPPVLLAVRADTTSIHFQQRLGAPPPLMQEENQFWGPQAGSRTPASFNRPAFN